MTLTLFAPPASIQPHVSFSLTSLTFVVDPQVGRMSKQGEMYNKQDKRDETEQDEEEDPAVVQGEMIRGGCYRVRPA